MRNRFNKFYKPILIALAAFTLAVCAFFAVFLGVNNTPNGGGQLEGDTQITAEAVVDADTSGKTAVTLPYLAIGNSLTYDGEEHELRYSYDSLNVIIIDVTYYTLSDPITQTQYYHYDTEQGKVTVGTNPFYKDWFMKVTNAGTYNVTFELKNPDEKCWEGGSAAKTYTVTTKIAQKYPTVKTILSKGPYFTDDEDLPKITLDEANSTPGSIEWDKSANPSKTPGTIYPQWNFTPADRVNYAEIPGAEEIYYQIDVIEDVTIEWRDPNAEDNFIYTTSSVDKFKEKIIVTGILTSGKKVEDIAVTEYDVAGGAASWSSVGSHDIFVSVKTKTPDGKETTVPNSVAFRIEAKSRSATHITYTLKDPDKIYEATVTFDDIKANDLEVTAFYNDGNSEVLKPGDYTLTNISTDPVSTELSVGENITILITHDGVTEQFVIKEVIKSTHAVEVTFADVTVDYGEEYTVKITGDLPDGVSVAYEYRVYSEEGTENPDIIDAPTDAGKYTVTAIFTVDEDKYEAIESLEMTLTINKIAAALSDIEISGWTYGEAVSSPKVTAAAAATEHLTITYYKVSYKYSEANPDAAPEEELIEIDPPTSFLAVGTYCVKAEVLTDNNIDGEEKTATFTITARAITVTIDSFVGYKDENLKTLTATVTDGTLADGQNESDVFSLTSPADKNVAGVYSITGNVLNDNYDITFVGGENAYKIYQTVSVGEGALLGGQVDIAADGEYTLVVTAVSEDKIYGDLEGDLDIRGFKATLYKKVSGDVYVEVTDIPTIVRLAIPEGMTDYKFYSVDGEGATHEAEFKALEGGLIEFAYSGSFPMEFVYTAPIIRAPAIPWWVWLIAVLAVIAIIAIIAELAVRNKRPAHDDTAIIVEQIYNDEELKRILAEHGKRLADLEDRDNDGFDDPYEGGYNFA